MEELEQGELIGHFACPKCGGSDPLALYQKENHVDGNCWSNCGYMKPKELKELGVTDGANEVLVEAVSSSSNKKGYVLTEEIQEQLEFIGNKKIHGWPERKIPALVNEFYGVRSDVKGDGANKELVKEYCPAYNQKDQLVGYHVRNDAVKKAKNEGKKVQGAPFYSVGDVRASTKLFGQNKFEKGGKFVVLCSGQADARAVFTALNTEKVFNSELGKKVMKVSKFITPVVSTQCGESAVAQIRANYEWLSSFESVIIMYDQDDAGREGAEKIAKIMKAGQAKIAKYKRKDACEHSKRGEWEQIKSAYFKAERYSPVDVLHLSEMWEDFEKEDLNTKIPFPASMSLLNDKLGGGIEKGEITVLGAYTSIGKTSIINNIVYHLIDNTKFKVGAFYLEGTKREIVRDLMSLDMRVNLRLADRSELNMTQLRNRYMNSLASKDQFAFVDHQGACSTEDIFDKFHYLAEVECADVIIFDPLQAGVNSSDNSAIIDFMDRVLKFAKKTDTAVILVSHMRKPDSDDPHNISEYSLLGSSSINQIAFNTVLFSRDKLSDDPNKRNSTRLLLVKCRRTGLTGEAGWVRYDNDTTHFYPTNNPYIENDEPDPILFGESNDIIDDSDYDVKQEEHDWEVIDE
ncbi:MAG: hypothetical protein CME43_01775 [Haliea sp.]|uniref:DnaB-like helicase C-terminal domain-containing protein n=1 Tax=Haliea sp. TaxID=1932666 RepID=UPI000C4BBE23|nr:DnaB-like helicase C-terminal domain-containing protein [Haliea sp.]MBM68191.1 hypothetical protein [Haliea sp.]|tara:strand:- start:2496 stop:4388 length:1893 start_codon:yes stop_codon:yes gene_type:complete